MSVQTITPGTKVIIKSQSSLDGTSYVYRVMAVAEGWALLRYPRATPFAEMVKNLEVWRG